MKSSWILAENTKNETLLAEFERELACSKYFAQILLNLGLQSLQEAKSFLSPSLENLLDPFSFKQMTKAVDLVVKAIKRKRKILIYGDFDADGITSVTVLYRGLRELGADIDFFIPDRLKDGYGLSMRCAERILQEPPYLLITVDCGISAADTVKRLKSENVKVVVTDHHLPQGEIPPADAVLNPQLEDSGYACKYLAGVGVAFKLLSGVCISLDVDLNRYLYPNLIFVCLGTVADIVPLIEENRTLVRLGILSIKNRFNKGLTALIKSGGLNPDRLTSGNVVFNVAPKINAAGRMGDVKQAVNLFLSEDEDEINSIVSELEELNTLRRSQQDEIFELACQQIENKYSDFSQMQTLIVDDPSWHVGIIGIVASKLVETYNRPAIVFGQEGGKLRGSARSVSGFNMVKAIEQSKDFLIAYGGHKYAAGISLLQEYLPRFEEKVQIYSKENLTEEMVQPTFRVDMELDFAEIDNEFVQFLTKLSPFGPGNHKPVFLSKGLRIACSPRVVGANHLQVRLTDGEKEINFIGFGLGDYQKQLTYNSSLDIIYALDFNFWQSRVYIQGFLKDIDVY